MVFPVVMYGCESCDHIEGWVPKNWCFWIVVLEKTLQSPLDSKEIKSINPKGNQSWIFIGRTYAVAEAPILWPPNRKYQLIEKDPDAWKDWGQEENGTTENETVWQQLWCNGREFEQTPGDSEGQGSLVCRILWGHRDGQDWATKQPPQGTCYSWLRRHSS